VAREWDAARPQEAAHLIAIHTLTLPPAAPIPLPEQELGTHVQKRAMEQKQRTPARGAARITAEGTLTARGAAPTARQAVLTAAREWDAARPQEVTHLKPYTRSPLPQQPTYLFCE